MFRSSRCPAPPGALLETAAWVRTGFPPATIQAVEVLLEHDAPCIRVPHVSPGLCLHPPAPPPERSQRACVHLASHAGVRRPLSMAL